MCHEIEGIDILLTGHQHREMAQTVGNDVTILQTGCNGHSVGKVTVTFEKMKQEWVKKESYSELLTVQEIEADPDVLYLVADYEEKTQNGLINLLEPSTVTCKFQMLCKLVCKTILLLNS